MERPTVNVNGVPVQLWTWSHWQDAILEYDPAAALALAHGEAWIEDALGQPLDPGGAVVDGASITLRRNPEERETMPQLEEREDFPQAEEREEL